MTSWFLEDASARAAANPYTFYKPAAAELAKVRPGEVVKLIFGFRSDDPAAPGAERMWVRVDTIDGAGGFTGRLDNTPRWIADLAPDAPIAFRDIHVIATEHDPPDNVVEKYLPRCFVSARVLADGRPVGYLYREEPDRDDDSGWRLLAGDESQDYLDDPANLSYVSLGAVLNRDDAYVHLLDRPEGSAFVRQDDGAFAPDTA
jgi:hypothetical protein